MAYAGAGETISVYNDPQIRIVDTGGGGVITLPMGYTLERFFNLTTTITDPASLTLTGATRARKIKIKFAIDGGVTLTLPSNFVMSDVRFNDATKVWTPVDAGDYALDAWWDGSAWNTTITGPDNT